MDRDFGSPSQGADTQAVSLTSLGIRGEDSEY